MIIAPYRVPQWRTEIAEALAKAKELLIADIEEKLEKVLIARGLWDGVSPKEDAVKGFGGRLRYESFEDGTLRYLLDDEPIVTVVPGYDVEGL